MKRSLNFMDAITKSGDAFHEGLCLLGEAIKLLNEDVELSETEKERLKSYISIAGALSNTLNNLMPALIREALVEEIVQEMYSDHELQLLLRGLPPTDRKNMN